MPANREPASISPSPTSANPPPGDEPTPNKPTPNEPKDARPVSAEQEETASAEPQKEASNGSTADAPAESTTDAPAESTKKAPAESAEAAGGTDPTARPLRRTWRCAPSTMIVGIAFMVITGLAIPGAAVLAMMTGLTSFGDNQWLVLTILGGIAVIALVYGWRLVLHPRITLRHDVVRVSNPFRTRRLHLEDITRFRPGPNGLVIDTADQEVQAWCVQKSAGAIKHDRRTRADAVSDELWAIWEEYHRPEESADSRVHLRFVHPGEEGLLTELERSANLERLGHIFPADEFPYPEADVRKRWQAALEDPAKLIMVAESDGTAVGYACFGDRTIFHLGVAGDHQRIGIGTALLQAAQEELFADASTPEIALWVLQANDVARAFYRKHGWQDTDETRESVYPPNPVEQMMVLANPHRARRGI